MIITLNIGSAAEIHSALLGSANCRVTVNLGFCLSLKIKNLQQKMREPFCEALSKSRLY